MPIPVQLEIFMKDLTKAGLQSVGKNVDGVENQTRQLIAALNQVIASQKHQMEVNKAAGMSYTQEAANIQALTGQVRGLEAGLKSLNKTQQETTATQPKIDIDTDAVERKTGNLKMQFAQVARELPSLAMEPQMFILAVSNNLPMLADAIADVRKQNELLAASGEKGVPVWKQMARAVISWQTALIAAISLGIVYGKEIGNWVKELVKGKKELTETLKLQDALNTAHRKGGESAAEESAKLRILYAASQDANKSMKERNKAVDELQKMYPSYFGKLTNEAILAGKAASAYDDLTKAIIRKGQAQAAEDIVADYSKKNWQLQRGINADTNWTNRNKSAYEAALKERDKMWKNYRKVNQGSIIVDSAAKAWIGNTAEGQLIEEYERRMGNIKKYTDEIAKNNKIIEGTAKQINTSAYINDERDGDYSKSTKAKTDYASQLADARIKAQQTTEKLRLQIMMDGIAKRKAAARQEYDENLADIDKLERDTLARMDKARKQGDVIPDSQYESVKETARTNRLLAEQVYNEQLLQIDKEYKDKATQSFIDYNKRYGTYQEKRLAIAMDYAQKIAKAEKEGDEYKKKALELEGKEALSALDFSKLKDSINWEVVFGDMDKVSKDALKKVQLRLKTFKNSEEYKSMAVDQKKVVDEALNNIQTVLIDRGGLLGDLPGQLRELAEAQEELSRAQEEYNEVMKNGTDEQKEAAGYRLNKAQQKEQNAQTNVRTASDRATDNLIVLSNAITQLGSDSEMSLSQIGSLAGDITNIFTEAGNKIGGIIGAVFSLLDAIGTRGFDKFVDNLFGSFFRMAGSIWETLTFGLVRTHESDRSLQNDVERLTLSNEALKAAIDNLAEKMDDSAVSEANSIYEQQKQNLKESMANTQEMMQRSGAAYSKGFMGVGGTHSSNNKIDKAMSATDWERVSKAAGISVRNAGEFWTLTSEQMYNVANEASDLYAKIKQHADDGHRDAAQYMDEYIEYWKQLEELEESLFEKQTDTPFDTLRSEFKDILLDMESDADDFAAKFSKSMQKAMIESMMSDTYSKQLKDWYKDFAGAMSDGDLTKGEQSALKTAWDNIVADALAEREALKDMLGWKTEEKASSQNPGSGALTTMSQDSISRFEGIGRNMQTHLANMDSLIKDIRETQRLDSQTLATIAKHTAYLVLMYDIMEDMKINGIKMK